MLGERIRERRKALGLTAEALAEELKVIRNTVYRWENEDRAPSDTDKRRIAHALNTSVSYLMCETDDPAPLLGAKTTTGSNNALISAEESAHIESNVATLNDAMMIPVVSDDVSACCGKGSIYAEDVKWEIVGYYPVDPNDLIGYTWQTDKFQIIRASGDSMEPRIYDGERIIFAEELEIENANFAVVLWDGYTLIRVVLFNSDGTVTLRSMKEDKYKDIIVIPGDERFCILGKVLGIAPSIKKIGAYY